MVQVKQLVGCVCVLAILSNHMTADLLARWSIRRQVKFEGQSHRSKFELGSGLKTKSASDNVHFG